MEPAISHIQITVRDLGVAEPFYDRLMPLLGFVPLKKGAAQIAAHDLKVVEYQHPGLQRHGRAGDYRGSRRPEGLFL